MEPVTEKEMGWEDHLAAAVRSFRKEVKEWRSELLPEEFRSHSRAARREMLLAWRSLLDAQISKLEEEDKQKAAPQARKIQVE